MVRLALLTVVASLGASALDARADGGRAGILPLAGDPVLAARVDRELGRAVAERGVRGVLGPVELSAELGAAPGVQAALADAGALLDRSARAVLYMKRGEALDLARQALAKLEGTHARHHARALLGRAHAAVARALLLKPSDESGAREAFRLAVAADPGFAGEALAPRAAALLEAARREARATAPAAEELSRVTTSARLEIVLWFAVRAVGSQVELELVAYRPVAGELKRIVRSGRAEAATAIAAELVAGLLRRAPATAPGSAPASRVVVVLPPPVAPAPAPAPPRARPWYKTWWVWTIAGVVLAGAGVGLGVGLGRSKGPPPPGLDVEFVY
jgi:hypothetical protein